MINFTRHSPSLSILHSHVGRAWERGYDFFVTWGSSTHTCIVSLFHTADSLRCKVWIFFFVKPNYKFEFTVERRLSVCMLWHTRAVTALCPCSVEWALLSSDSPMAQKETEHTISKPLTTVCGLGTRLCVHMNLRCSCFHLRSPTPCFQSTVVCLLNFLYRVKVYLNRPPWSKLHITNQSTLMEC